jgi:hypothetical protein
MATLRSDIVIPEIFTPYLEEATTQRSQFLQSGILAPMEALNVTEGGDYVQVPSWDANLTGDAERLTDDTSLTPGKLTADYQRGVVMHRGRLFEHRELAKLAAGSDPMAALGNKLGDYVAHQQQKDLLAILEGSFGPLTSNTTGALKDLAIDDGASGQAVLGPSTVARVRAALGDAGEKLTACCMHSATYYDLYERRALDFVAASDTAGSFPDSANDAVGGSFAGAFGSPQVALFMGMRVIVSDDVTKSGSNYAVYFFAPGSVGSGSQQGLKTETDRDIAAQSDALAVTWHNVFHPMGLRYKTAAGANPTRTTLATASTWEQVWETKNIGVARATVISNFD